jgi:hypothetical protein
MWADRPTLLIMHLRWLPQAVQQQQQQQQRSNQ